jgi:hypothetical protein
MKSYRVIKDNFLGYEAQVRYAWFPFIWFQMNDFYWINTWATPELAISFIEQKKSGHSVRLESNELNSEYEKEVKLLIFHSKNFSPKVIWTDTKNREVERGSKRWWPVLNSLNG